jgi:hypothetical protein
MVLYKILLFKEELESQIETIREKIRINNEKQRVLIELLSVKPYGKHIKKAPLFFDGIGKEPFIGNGGQIKKQVFHPVPTTHMRNHAKKIQEWILNLDAKDKTPWTKEKDERLLDLKEKGFSWIEIGKILDKVDGQCALRYCKLKEMEVSPVKWDAEMDKKLLDLVEKHGEKEMYLITKIFNQTRKGYGLNTEQISYRYRYMLRPDIEHGSWKPEEDLILIAGLRFLEVTNKRHLQFQELHRLMKSKRTCAQIRNRMEILAKNIPNLPYFRSKTPAKRRKRNNTSKQRKKRKKNLAKEEKCSSQAKTESNTPLGQNNHSMVKAKTEDANYLKKEKETNSSAAQSKPKSRKKRKRKKINSTTNVRKKKKISFQQSISFIIKDENQ